MTDRTFLYYLKVCIQRRKSRMKEVMIWTGAGQIGMAIARRMGFGIKIVVGDKKLDNAQTVAKIMNDAGFDVVPMEMDLSSRDSIRSLIAEAQKYGEISMLVNAAGVSPSQAPIEAILKVDLYGTAVLLEEVGRVIKDGGTGVTISSQSGHRMPALSAEVDEQLACTPTEDLLKLEVLQPENIKDTLHAYQMAKRCNEKRVMAESIKWGARGARINSISPGIIVTPLAIDEFNGPRGDFYKNMFAKCPAGRPGTADEVANVAELLMSPQGAFITGADFLIDGGATASYFYGPLKPQV
jgi:NAD(P)-dependent dehydrogenase (short-subunit alcohol dehydrogenase family)